MRSETITPGPGRRSALDRLTRLARTRRFWETAAAVLLVLLATNAVLLLARFDLRQDQALDRLRDEAWAVVRTVDRLASAKVAPADFVTIAEQVIPGTRIEGGAIHDADGNTVQVFGKAPRLTPERRAGRDRTEIAGTSLAGDSYDIAWRVVDQGDPYYIVVRTDASAVAALRSHAAWDLIGEALAASLIAAMALLVPIGRALSNP